MEGNPLEQYEASNLIKKIENETKISLSEIAVGEEIHIETGGSNYILEHREDGFYLSGNKKYCPTPTKASIHGSTWGGSMLMTGVISEGMRMEIFLEDSKKTITTSPVKKIDRGITSLSA